MTSTNLPATDDQVDEPEPWERQHGESKKHYDQFIRFRDQPRPRSLRRVAEQLRMHPVSIRRTAAANGWQDRAIAWDNHLDTVYVAEIHEARRRAAREDMAILAKMRELTMRRLTDADIEHLLDVDSMAKLARWIDSHMKHTRVLFGDPTEHVTVSGPGGGPVLTEDWTDLTDDQKRTRLQEATEAALRRLAAIQETSTPYEPATPATGQHDAAHTPTGDSPA